jgi:hypothetical protein
MTDYIIGIFAQRHSTELSGIIKSNAFSRIELNANSIVPSELEIGWNDIEGSAHAKMCEKIERFVCVQPHANVFASTKERRNPRAANLLFKREGILWRNRSCPRHVATNDRRPLDAFAQIIDGCLYLWKFGHIGSVLVGV